MTNLPRGGSQQIANRGKAVTRSKASYCYTTLKPNVSKCDKPRGILSKLRTKLLSYPAEKLKPLFGLTPRNVRIQGARGKKKKRGNEQTNAKKNAGAYTRYRENWKALAQKDAWKG